MLILHGGREVQVWAVSLSWWRGFNVCWSLIIKDPTTCMILEPPYRETNEWNQCQRSLKTSLFLILYSCWGLFADEPTTCMIGTQWSIKTFWFLI